MSKATNLVYVYLWYLLNPQGAGVKALQQEGHCFGTHIWYPTSLTPYFANQIFAVQIRVEDMPDVSGNLGFEIQILSHENEVTTNNWVQTPCTIQMKLMRNVTT